MEQLQKKLDEVARELAKLDDDKFSQWASYLLEAIESESGTAGLTRIDELLEERSSNGRW